MQLRVKFPSVTLDCSCGLLSVSMQLQITIHLPIGREKDFINSLCVEQSSHRLVEQHKRPQPLYKFFLTDRYVERLFASVQMKVASIFFVDCSLPAVSTLHLAFNRIDAFGQKH